MSVVSTVVVAVGEWDEGLKRFEAHLEAFGGVSTGPPTRWHRLRPDEDFGGYKAAECEVYTAAFNHLSWGELVEHLDAFVFEFPLQACALMTSNDQDWSGTWRANQ